MHMVQCQASLVFCFFTRQKGERADTIPAPGGRAQLGVTKTNCKATDGSFPGASIVSTGLLLPLRWPSSGSCSNSPLFPSNPFNFLFKHDATSRTTRVASLEAVLASRNVLLFTFAFFCATIKARRAQKDPSNNNGCRMPHLQNKQERAGGRKARATYSVRKTRSQHITLPRHACCCDVLHRDMPNRTLIAALYDV